jgi:hypothetical protein
MRFLLPALGILACAASIATRAEAQNYPWCAQYGGLGGTNCGFTTLEQCQETSRGMGGSCMPNTSYTGPAAPTRAPAGTAATVHRQKANSEDKPKDKPHEKLVAPQPQ